MDTDWSDITPTAFGAPHDTPDIAALPPARRPWARRARVESQARTLTQIARDEGPDAARAALNAIAATEGRDVFDGILDHLHGQQGHAQAS